LSRQYELKWLVSICYMGHTEMLSCIVILLPLVALADSNQSVCVIHDSQRSQVGADCYG